MKKKIFAILVSCVLLISLFGCGAKKDEIKTTTQQETTVTETTTQEVSKETSTSTTAVSTTEEEAADEVGDETTTQKKLEGIVPEKKVIKWNDNWEYAKFSKIHTDSATLYYAKENRKNITICVNAGHGTKGGSSKKTQCHPDGTPKVTGGSTSKGSVYATSINEGMQFKSGLAEPKATLSLAILLKDKLLASGYDVLMVRESDDAQLDNIARTVMANNNADCHIALHYDSTSNDKGLFFIGVPMVKSYLNMEPVKSHYKDHLRFGKSVVEGAKQNEVKIFSNGEMKLDLTQTSYSTVPSIDVEVGDRGSDTSKKTQSQIADGIVNGINIFFAQ